MIQSKHKFNCKLACSYTVIMKRVRGEQLQALVLTHLKRRNFTDSETNFKSNFAFEESIKVKN